MMVVLVVMMMVVVVGGLLVKICVNVACWEKVIGREKLPRAQRISQARGSLTGQIFNRQSLLHHQHHHHRHDDSDLRQQDCENKDDHL